MGIGSWFGRRGRDDEEAKREFGLLALSIVRAQPGVAGADFDEREFVIRYGASDGQVVQMGLTTPFRRCRGTTGAASQLLESYVRGLVEAAGPTPPETFEAIAPRLRVVLRQAGILATRVRGMRLAENTLWRPVLAGLMEQVVIDAPTAMTTVTPHHLSTWGVDAETVFATARANLNGLARTTVEAFGEADDPILYLADADGELYAGSLPLVPGWIGALRERYGCEVMVFVPGNTGVLAGAVTSPQRAVELVEFARELYEEAVRPVSPVPYTADPDGRLVPFQVPPGHPARLGIRAAESTLSASVYSDQYEWLLSDLENHADLADADSMPGKLLHVRDRNGVESTLAPWVDQVPTLLPYADRVVLTSVESGAAVEVAWPDLARELALRPVPGLFPERYRVEHHPDHETVARLAAAHSS